MKQQDKVVLQVPENPLLDQEIATIEEITEWGAHVLCKKAATGKFRALFSEMKPYQDISKQTGYTGDCCPMCGSTRMRRNGNCLMCEGCFSTTGC